MSIHQSHPKPHPALFIPEVLLHCFQDLGRSGLASAALVCKDWSISLDLLWKEHKVPLSVIVARLNEISKSKLPQSDKIDLYAAFFKRTAQKITQLDVDQDITDTIAEILKSISSTLQTHLIPNLRDLRLSTSKYKNPEDSVLFKTMITKDQRITSLTIENHPEEDLEKIFMALGNVTPHVQQFTLGAPEYPGNFNIDCGVFQQLRVAYLQDIDPDAWRPLVGGCHFLEEVVLTVGEDEYCYEDPYPEPIPTSLSLRNLTIEWSAYAYAIASTIMPNLRTITFGRLPSETDITHRLAKHSPDLACLDITYEGVEIGEDTLEGISKMTELRVVDLSGLDGILFTDDSIDHLARSLPHLKRLSLPLTDEYRISPAFIPLTWDSLESLLRHCSSLEDVELSLNFSDFQLNLTDVRPTVITRVTISDPTLPDDEEVLKDIAKCLAAWCPNAKELWGGPDPYARRDHKDWDELVSLFKLYRESNSAVL
ncbi:hypothetical protein FRB94_009107 [Tulasnella sp. JGI-2019a]|nr:hypothetical protein FRB94_009107 [Tulasnella sp. JGI-2019a]KAG9034499.1 hypothetical protein FRB95_013175 [Tulasnella sp. JGI-2019a]